MATYIELLKQIEALTQQAEELRQTEVDNVIVDIREKMKEYGLTRAPVGP